MKPQTTMTLMTMPSMLKSCLLVTALAGLTAALTPARLAAQQSDAAADAWAAGDHARARELYALRVAADSSDVRALHRLGLLLAWTREYAGAIPLLERAVELAPSAEARTDLANVLAWSGSYDRALAVLDDVLAHAPTSDVLHSRARFLSWSGRYREAEAAYRTLTDADPLDGAALRGIARVTTWRGDLAAGERLWRAAVAAEPDNADARVGLSQVLRWRGRSREALVHAEAAVRLRPDDRDALEQLAWAEAGFAPRIAPRFSVESDSDDNRLYTAAVNATIPMSRRLAATLNGYVRRADGPTPPGVDPTAASTSAVAGLRAELGEGWTMSAGVGVTDRSTGDPTAVYSAGVASPAWLPVHASVAWSHSVLDATADLIRREVATDALSVTAGAELTRGLRLDAGAGFTRFNGATTNDRLLGRLGLEARPTTWLRVRPRILAFGFENSVQEGYFAPDRYALAELGIAIERNRGAWSLSGEVAPGAQRIGSAGEVLGTLSGSTRVGYAVAPGREVGISLSLSNLGFDRLQAGATGYRYQALAISAAWGF